MEPTENGNFHWFAANGGQKRQTSICFLQTENGSLFSLVGKRQRTFAVSANVPIYGTRPIPAGPIAPINTQK
jgi:hypothetical protein